MGDGAHLNVDVESAMGKIVGGEEVRYVLTDEEFEQNVRFVSAEPGGGVSGYERTGWLLARGILETYETFPMLQTWPSEPVYLRDDRGNMVWSDGRGVRLSVGLSETIKTLHAGGHLKTAGYLDAYEGCTGFQWGWAVNAARKVLGLGAVPNPAILEVGVQSEG